ncbi:ABC transporter substrate-binding protein [Streptosporangium sp. NBC_01755]|uniref:ABC transporter substrate-binding protein n=1 Tax=Streptosporangium sp. NBC_01755 TaxID=2975949 RepID=UPI002DD7A9B6|nr:ABC transporter substrate-binding protein [Streptosporangium sp. NBC_01755]WSC97228.1 ABC transporter substrate-binding protein [Streptosporangium sp. NBC_01755]
MTELPDVALTRRSLLRSIAIVSGLAAVPGLAVACGSPEPATGGPAGAAKSLDVLKVALPSSLGSLDASKEAGIMNYVVALLCQEALVGVGRDGSLQPSLAESWTRKDATTYVYAIRQGVTFSDGTPLTADDVVASLDLHARKGSTSAFAYAYANVKKIEASGPAEVTITLKRPDASFAWTPSPGTLMVTSRKFIEVSGDGIGTPTAKILGTGPYRVTEFAPDSHVTLERNDAWWGGKAPYRRIDIDFVPEESTRLLAMRGGSVDVALNVPAEQIDQWKGLPGVEVKAASDRSLVTLAFNTAKKPWDDVHVRRAVAHAVDREGILRSVLRGHGRVATTLTDPAQWGGVLGEAEVENLYASIPQYGFDLAKARAELAASSVPGGFADVLTYPNSGPQLGRAALTLAENLKGIGITLEVKEVPLEQWIAELGKHASGIYLGWYFATTGDPAEYIQQLLNGAATGVNGTNIAEYANAEVTGLLDEAKTGTDDTARGRLLGEALVKAAGDVPYQPLWWGEAATAFGPGVGTGEFGPYFFVGPWATEITTRS